MSNVQNHADPMGRLAADLLVVEDNPLDAHLVRAMLQVCGIGGESVLAGTLSETRACLQQQRFDLILLDLSLPDTTGLDTLRQVRALTPETPIVVLTGRDDQETALQAVREGAQDYLNKEGLDGDVLARAIRYAIERQRLLSEIRAMSLRDELTGLYNRRGFFALAEQQLRVAARTGCCFALFFVDLDGMKQINDVLGHAEGDHAIREASSLLTAAFRASDIVARIGGDEFVVLAAEVQEEGTDVILRRLAERLAGVNAGAGRRYALSVSVGAVVHDPSRPISVDELLSRADSAMYAQKRGKSRPPRGSASDWTFIQGPQLGSSNPLH
jgi:two-component system, cell cycle response regulator